MLLCFQKEPQSGTETRETGTPRTHYLDVNLALASIYRHVSRQILKCFFYQIRVPVILA